MPFNFLMPPEIRGDNTMEPHDAGWRKYMLILLSIALLVWGFWWTGVADVAKEILERRAVTYTTFAEFLLGLVGLYFGANVAYKGWAGSENRKTKIGLAQTKMPDEKGVEGSGKAKE